MIRKALSQASLPFLSLLFVTRPIRQWDAVLWKTNDCEPYEWTEESLARMTKLVNFWRESGPFYIILSGGLPNKNGATIADSIKEKILTMIPETQSFIIPEQDNQSQDTAGEVEFVAPIFLKHSQRFSAYRPRLFVLSNFQHVMRLWIMFLFKRIKIGLIISPLSGGFAFKTKRFLNETILFILTIVDPNYRLFIFQRERTRRAKLARNRDLRKRQPQS